MGPPTELRDALRVYEKQYIRHMLHVHRWNKPKTAEYLGIGLSTLYRKIKELQIRKE